MGNNSNRILIVDEDYETLDVLKSFLEKDGYLVDVTNHPQKALKILSVSRYTVVLSDNIMLSDITEHCLFKYILKKNQGIQIILMAAYSSIEKMLDAYRLITSDYLLKPFDFDEVLQVVERSCRQYDRWFELIKTTLANQQYKGKIVALTTLYSPEELTEKRASFLSRTLQFFDDIPDVIECANIVGHKLHETGGNLGLTSLSTMGATLQSCLDEKGDKNQVQARLIIIKEEILKVLTKIQGEFPKLAINTGASYV